MLQEYNQKLIDFNVSIYVRRGGPNYQEGIRIMKEVGRSLNLPIYVFGPETHMTAIVGMALGKRDIPSKLEPVTTTANFLLPTNSVCIINFIIDHFLYNYLTTLKFLFKLKYNEKASSFSRSTSVSNESEAKLLNGHQKVNSLKQLF